MTGTASPTVHSANELATRFARANQDPDQTRFAGDLLLCYTYTAPQRLEELFTQDLFRSTPRLVAYRWRAEGILANQNGDHKRAELAFKEALQAAEEDGLQDLQTDILLDWSGSCLHQGDLAGGRRYLDQANHLHRVYPHPKQQYHLLVRQGLLALAEDDAVRAYDLLQRADRLSRTLGDRWGWDDLDTYRLLTSGLGALFTRNGERQEALRAYRRVIELCRDYHLHAWLPWHYLDLGNAAMGLERWDEATDAFQQALTVNEVVPGPVRAAVWANLGHVLLQQGRAEAAGQALDQAEHLYAAADDRKNLAVVETWRGKLAIVEGHHEAAMRHFIQASEFARAVKDNVQLAEICKDIAQHFATRGDFENAYEYLALYDALREKAQEEAQQHRLMELQIKYQSEQKEQEAEALRGQALSLRLRAMRAQMNPHFLFNALNGIQNLIHSEDPDRAARYLAKFAGLVRQSLNMSNTELITLEEEVAFIQDYLLVNQVLRFQDRLSYTVSVDEALEDDVLVIPPMLVQPFVENAIEHAFIQREHGQIKVHFAAISEEQVVCTIVDDGIGRPAAVALQAENATRKEHRSLGVNLTKERLDLLNRSGFPGHRLDIHDLTDDEGQALGTRIELYFPIRQHHS